MAVESTNVEKLSEWLADGSAARSSNPAAETLVEKLAALVFQGDWEWPSHTDRVDGYRDRLREQFGGDSGREAQFVNLTGADSEPDALIDWFLPVVVEWEGRGARTAPEGAPTTADEAPVPLQNPNCDGTPGTEFYRFDAATQEYLYTASASGGDWASYEQRRYSERARDDGYGLEYRYDRRDGVYEWYDAAAGAWRDQAWADQRHATGTRSPAQSPAPGASTAESAPAWDENWRKFYRVGSDGRYEFADALVPGQKSSGCGGEWLGQEQILARQVQKPTAGADERAPGSSRARPAAKPVAHTDTTGTRETARRKIERAVAVEVAAAIAEIEGAEKLTPAELEEIRAELVAEFSAGSGD